jgi:hypothetical protein
MGGFSASSLREAAVKGLGRVSSMTLSAGALRAAVHDASCQPHRDVRP